MKLENPFQGMAYITEKGVNPEKVLERYSIFPLKYLLHYLNTPINCFFVGRTGVGKTMILALFDLAYQKELYSKIPKNDSMENRKNIIDLLPKEVIGIYSNIDSPYIRLTQFQGRTLHEKESWMKVFGDYYGHILVRNLISTIEELSKVENWRKQHNIKELDDNILNLISKDYSKKISNELSDFKDISSWSELKNYIDNRISTWIRAVNTLGAENFPGPSETVQLIAPCLYLIEEFKNKNVIGEDCRLFIIIDQYETLYDHRNNIDFRPVFNLAMRQAARGETRIEFKMGVRPYGYRDNLEILGSNIKLDLEKECNEIFIDDLTSQYYKKFIEDLTIKCLSKYDVYKNIKKAEELFEDLKPIEEVKKYVGDSIILNKHFSLFFQRNPKREKIINIIEDIAKNRYLFNWEKIPGEDIEKLTKFLKEDFGIDWLKTAKIETTDSGRTIKVYNEINSLSLELTEEGTKINLQIDDGRTDEFVARTENSELNIYTNICPTEYKIWIETLLAIYAERYLSKKKNVELTFLRSKLNEHFRILQSILSNEYEVPYEYSRYNIPRDLKNKGRASYKDIKSGALFIIASAYKNKPKIYSGYDTLVLTSSRIVLHYIEILSEAFNLYLLENKDEVGPIPAVLQSSALYRKANRFFDSIPDKVPHGVTVSNFLKNLGVFFRWLQLDPMLNKPHPNGFSITHDLADQFDSNRSDEDIRLKADIIREVLSYGFLEEAQHKDKRSRYRGKRYKYYLNRLLCPYFGIPVPHRKDPIYIHEDNKFLNYLFEKDVEVSKFKKFLSLKTSEGETTTEDLTKFL